MIFCGRQCLPLRDHRGDGPFNFDKMMTENEGVFRALIRFRIETGDTPLKKNLDYGPKNAHYLSPIIQNEIIAIYSYQSIFEFIIWNISYQQSCEHR